MRYLPMISVGRLRGNERVCQSSKVLGDRRDSAKAMVSVSVSGGVGSTDGRGADSQDACYCSQRVDPAAVTDRRFLNFSASVCISMAIFVCNEVLLLWRTKHLRCPSAESSVERER